MKFTFYIQSILCLGVLVFAFCTTSITNIKHTPLLSYTTKLEEKEDALKEIVDIVKETLKENVVLEEVPKMTPIATPKVVEKKKEPIVDTKVEEKEEVIETSKIEEPIEIPIEEKIEEPKVNILETLIGSLSGYGPDCTGCTSFRTASGYDLRNERITYEDETYGTVRIISGDKKYPFGTIVKISNCSYLEQDVIAIVLDRGGNVGIDRGVTFDLLFKSEKEASSLGKRNQVTFEILRLGY